MLYSSIGDMSALNKFKEHRYYKKVYILANKKSFPWKFVKITRKELHSVLYIEEKKK